MGRASKGISVASQGFLRKLTRAGTGDVAQLVERLPNAHGVPGFDP